MIFLTLGTQQPFDRLVRAVDRWCAAGGTDEVLAQIPDPGPRGYRPTRFDWTTWIAPDEYRARFASARFVIAHAGMGSLITAMTLAKPILVMPRRAHLGEQRNDHQLATAQRFGGKPGIHVAMDEDELVAAADRLAAAPDGAEVLRIGPFAEDRLTDGLRAAIASARRTETMSRTQ